MFIHSIYTSLHLLTPNSRSISPPTCQHRAIFTPEVQWNVEQLILQGPRSLSSFVTIHALQLCVLSYVLMPSFLCPSFLYFRLQHLGNIFIVHATSPTLSASWSTVLQNPGLTNIDYLPGGTPLLCFLSGGHSFPHFSSISVLGAGGDLKIDIIFFQPCIGKVLLSLC